MPNLTVSTSVDDFMQSANVSAMQSAVGLGNVENIALSTWAGSTNITTLGTIWIKKVPADIPWSPLPKGCLPRAIHDCLTQGGSILVTPNHAQRVP